MAQQGQESPQETGAAAPTIYLEVNAALEFLLAEIRRILGRRFQGLYLSGSLALGDFDPRSSDIDFVTALDGDLSDQRFAALRQLHERFNQSSSVWATQVEAAYVPLTALRRHDPAHSVYASIERDAGKVLQWDHLDHGWIIQRSILREHGVTLAGPPPWTLIEPVPADELRSATARVVQDWWSPMVENPALLRERGAGYQSYAILTMCRILYTLRHGAIISKPAAARWAIQEVNAQWAAPIAWAIEAARGNPTLAGGGLDAALALIAYTRERCRC